MLAGYYTLAGLYTLAASVIWGVNTLFLLDAGLSFFEVFVANAAFSAGTVLFELPTGIVADTLGRRVSFLLSASLLTVSTLVYVLLAQVAAGVVPFVLASVLMALGFTFYSGAVEAWLVDALEATGFEGSLDRVFARGQQVTGAAMLVGTVGGGLLGELDLSVPYVVRSALLVVVLVVAYLRMHDLGFTPHRVSPRALPREASVVARDGVVYGWRVRPIRLVITAGAIQAGFASWAFYAWQPYLLDLLGRDAVWIAGLVSAGVALSTMAGNQVVEVAARACGRRSTLLLWAAGIQVVGAVAVGVFDSFVPALAALLLVTGSLGVAGPVRQAYIHQLVPGSQRATLVSFDSMVAGAGGVGGQLGLGWLGEARSIGAAFVAGGLATATALPVLGAVRRLGGRADVVRGVRAGVTGSCAGQGLPSVAAVEARSSEAAV